MRNERRVKRLRVLIYTVIVILLFLPLLLAVVGVRLLFAVGKMEDTMASVAGRMESAAVSLETSVKQASLTIESAKTAAEWASLPPMAYEPPPESTPVLPADDILAGEQDKPPANGSSEAGTAGSSLPSPPKSADLVSGGSDWAPDTGK